MEEKKRKKVNPELIVFCCVVAVVLFFITCSMIRVSIFETNMGECISISPFGKLELRDIDKVVVTTDDSQITITDQNLIGQITDETRIATHVRSRCGGPDYCDDPYGRIDLYREDNLIRSMEWDTCCDSVYVYERDLTHWLIPWWCDYDGGYVSLSDELAEQLNALTGS